VSVLQTQPILRQNIEELSGMNPNHTATGETWHVSLSGRILEAMQELFT